MNKKADLKLSVENAEERFHKAFDRFQAFILGGSEQKSEDIFWDLYHSKNDLNSARLALSIFNFKSRNINPNFW